MMTMTSERYYFYFDAYTRRRERESSKPLEINFFGCSLRLRCCCCSLLDEGGVHDTRHAAPALHYSIWTTQSSVQFLRVVNFYMYLHVIISKYISPGKNQRQFIGPGIITEKSSRASQLVPSDCRSDRMGREYNFCPTSRAQCAHTSLDTALRVPGIPNDVFINGFIRPISLTACCLSAQGLRSSFF